MNYFNQKNALMIRVVTYLGDTQEAERDINYNDPLHRKWLGSHCFWAFMNGRTVETGRVEVMG